MISDQIHGMAKGNLNQTEKFKTKNTTAWKLITLAGDRYDQKLNSPIRPDWYWGPICGNAAERILQYDPIWSNVN